MSKNIVFEGWLTKSPPTKRIWRAKWRRRWFALRQSGELPGQYFLDYYADRNCRRLKGTINLDLCEQVDAGLHMERGDGSLDPKIRGSVFTVRTQSRTYHLEADCEEEMERWVDAICRVCGLRATDEPADVHGTYQNTSPLSNDQYDCPEGNGLYIPISECITGVRQDTQRAFTFDPKSIVTSGRSYERVSAGYCGQSLRLPTTDCSENESNMSDDDCKSLNASQPNIDWSVTKTFTKLAVSPSQRDGAGRADEPGNSPPPPRPPKPFQGPRMQEPAEAGESLATGHASRRVSYSGSPRSAHRPAPAPALAPATASATASATVPATFLARYSDDEDETAPGHPSSQYCNLSSLPPAVDRALKPRFTVLPSPPGAPAHPPEVFGSPYRRRDSGVLQYLDLDLREPTAENRRRTMETRHKHSLSAAEGGSAYKTVDFIKTEAFNITRQDAEATRNMQQ